MKTNLDRKQWKEGKYSAPLPVVGVTAFKGKEKVGGGQNVEKEETFRVGNWLWNVKR